MRGWAVIPYVDLAPPIGGLQTLSRWIAANLTPLCWIGYLFTIDGLLEWRNRRQGEPRALHGSPIRPRPRRFVFCFLASVPLWLWFDWVNFSFIDAWRYHGLPDNIVHRNLVYFFAFGAISPAMFLTAELYQRLGLGPVQGKSIRIGLTTEILLICIGCAFLVFPFAVRAPVGSLTMWLGWLLLLDPINSRLGAPSIFADWREGRFGRTLALLAAGATCGILWEFWNYWATAKWTYHLPFLGQLEEYRYFEMPLVGFLGFPVFAIESWVMFQTLVWVIDRLRSGVLESLPDERNLL